MINRLFRKYYMNMSIVDIVELLHNFEKLTKNVSIRGNIYDLNEIRNGVRFSLRTNDSPYSISCVFWEPENISVSRGDDVVVTGSMNYSKTGYLSFVAENVVKYTEPPPEIPEYHTYIKNIGCFLEKFTPRCNDGIEMSLASADEKYDFHIMTTPQNDESVPCHVIKNIDEVDSIVEKIKHSNKCILRKNKVLIGEIDKCTSEILEILEKYSDVCKKMIHCEE